MVRQAARAAEEDSTGKLQAVGLSFVLNQEMAFSCGHALAVVSMSLIHCALAFGLPASSSLPTSAMKSGLLCGADQARKAEKTCAKLMNLLPRQPAQL